MVGPEKTPAFRVAENDRNFKMPEIWQPVAVNFEEKIKLLGYNLPTRRIQPGQGLALTLFWQGQEWLGEDFVIFTRLLDNATPPQAWAGYDRLARENYSTLFWAPEEIVVDGFALEVAPDTPAGVYWLNVGWYREVAGQAQSLPIVNPDSGESRGETALTIGPFKVGGAPAGVTIDQVSPQVELNTRLGDQLKLSGVDVTQPDPSEIILTFYWEPLDALITDYTVFIHVRNEAGDIVAQKDSPPLQGAYPSSLWDRGEIIRDRVEVSLPDLEPGHYEIVIGLYDFASQQRLIIENSVDNTITVQSFQVNE